MFIMNEYQNITDENQILSYSGKILRKCIGKQKLWIHRECFKNKNTFKVIIIDTIHSR